MDKLKLHTPDFSQENATKLLQLLERFDLFPNCITESKAEDGSIERAIDFDLLRQEASGEIVEGPRERYRLDWPGKREALATANAPIAKTLRPCREESVDFDSTNNLYIEGDNLDALKLLQETYLNQVKMIYIDPPYNTGKDFIYDDDFKENAGEYLERSNQTNDEGIRLVANSETNGRFHSDWLSMMYARLKLARNLLSDDGAIFISIDDGEQSSLNAICREIFGDDNFLGNFIWEKRITRENRKQISVRHDYIVAFAKSNFEGSGAIGLLPMNDDALERYKNLDDDPRGPWTSVPAIAQAGHGTPNQFYTLTTPAGRSVDPPSGSCWRYTKKRMDDAISDNRIWFGSDGNGVPRIKKFLNEGRQGLTPETIWWAKDVGTNDSAKRELVKLFSGVAVFDTPKPASLIRRMLEISSDENSIVLDFFAGCAPLPEAAFCHNLQTSSRTRFITVQLPEPCEESSEALKVGLPTIAEIGKERIRRAGTKIRAELEAQLEGELPGSDKHDEITARLANLDTGFRVLKVATSNMADVYHQPDEVAQEGLELQVENIKPDRTPEDLLFQVLLDWGVDLALPIEEETIVGKTVFFVDGNALAASFDTGLDEAFVKELAEREPLRAVFRDASFATDATKINIEQIFKALSPHTELKAI